MEVANAGKHKSVNGNSTIWNANGGGPTWKDVSVVHRFTRLDVPKIVTIDKYYLQVKTIWILSASRAVRNAQNLGVGTIVARQDLDHVACKARGRCRMAHTEPK